MNNIKKKKVLIIRFSAMGDVIFTLPLANVLKKSGYEVSWLTGDKGYELLKNNPSVDEVIYVSEKKRKELNFFENLRDFFKTILYLRSKHFDISIDTQMLFKTLFWHAFCGAKRQIVSLSAREFSILGGNEIIEKLYTNWETHVTSDYLKFAKYLGLDTTGFEVTMPPAKEEDTEKANTLLTDIDPSKPIITIAPATTWKGKHWDRENWKKLVSALSGKYNLVFTGTKNDSDLIDYISGGFGLNLAGKTTLKVLCEVLKKTDLLISLDSGTTHLGWAVQKPKILSIFCCTPKTRYAPLGSDDKYISLSGNLKCMPCHRKKCPLKENQNMCTNLPSVEEVLSAVHKLI